MKILWLNNEVLHPVDNGGRIRTYNLLTRLRRRHQITYAALADLPGEAAQVEQAREYSQQQIIVEKPRSRKFTPQFYTEVLRNLVSPYPYAVQRWASASLRAEVRRALERERYDLLICDFLSSTLNVPRPCPCPTILFQHNVEARLWHRHLETQSHWLRRLYLRSQWARLICYERAACSDFDHVVAVSAEDRDYFQQEYGLTAVSATPTGVDVEFFRPQFVGGLSGPPRTRLTAGLRTERPHHLVFTGGMDWLPNEDAMQHFADHIWPQVRQAVPDATLSIVGRTPTAKVQRLAERPGITVTGRVPDVRPYIDEAAVYIVPLRVGGGTRLKIYEAMAMAKPVVSTRVGAEGLDVRDGENILLADAPEPFAAAVIGLLREPHRRLALGAAARRLVEHRYSWERVVEQFETVCLETIHRCSETGKLGNWAAKQGKLGNWETGKLGNETGFPSVLIS